MGLLSPGFGSVSDDDTKYGFSPRDGAFYTDDAVIITGKPIMMFLYFITRYSFTYQNFCFMT